MITADLRLQAAGLTKAYPGLEVLRGVDLELTAGDVLAVVGLSGTGKSTLLNLLGLMDRPDTGSVLLDGTRIDHLGRRRRARLRAERMGFVFQAFNLLPEFDVEENVLMSARCAGAPLAPARRRAGRLLADCGLAAHAGATVASLSGGERQRVALCRALLMQPAVLLADEPTGNLDPRTARVIIDQLIHLARSQGSCVVIVTHDAHVAAHADHVLELREGRLAEPGAEFLAAMRP